ncbi:GGDEF domain-containing protein [uncultured Aquitalea sp.]|uniref:GGDEF domain-containing protein n=1 Tax=uncultured Aquitalea sp. TaxID=540272 RepID=UPI0025F5E783|nr:GGDEF domain-containing protein [uncultured Aquitalea sp.]
MIKDLKRRLLPEGKWRVDIPREQWPAFETYVRRYHGRFLLAVNLIGALAFFSYVIADALLIPDMAWASLCVRAVLLGVACIDIWLVFRRHSPASILLKDQLMPIHDIIASVAWFELLKRSHSPAVPTFLYASIIFVVFVNMGMRVSFRGAVFHSLAISAVIMVNLALMNPHDSQPLLVFALVYLPVLLFCFFISWTNISNVRRGFLASQADNRRKKELSALNHKLELLATTDALTRIGNRRSFDSQLQEYWALMRSHGRPFALLLADIDYFKPYNDHYGHQAGDHCLAAVAASLSGSLRSGQAMCFRYGGEEFAILLQVTDQQDLNHVAARLVEQVGHLPLAHDHRPDQLGRVTISIGAALSSLPGLADADALLNCCDRMLYQAKVEGRHRARVAANPNAAFCH